MEIFLLPSGDLRDMRAAVELIKEFGGRALHPAPIVGGLVVEAPACVVDICNLIPWR